MRILLVTGRFPQRSETFIYRKAVALANHGHEVTVLTRHRGDWDLYPDPLPAKLRVEELPPDLSRGAPTSAASAVVALARHAWPPARLRALWRLARHDARLCARHLPFLDREADVVHFEFLGLAAMYPFVRDLMNTRTITSCRGQDVHLLAIRSEADRAPLIECLKRSSALHCVSDELATVVAKLTSRRDGIWVNRPAVDVEKIVMRSAVSSSTTLRILMSGRLVWVKGYDYALRAFSMLAARGVDFRAEIVGDGELYSALRFSIADLGLQDRVSLAGGVSPAEVLARLATTDVFVLSSLEEGISNAVLEAMASGIPIVTTNAGGMAEAVTDGIEGFVVPIREATALADRIELLADSPARRREMGQAARQRAVAAFSLERQVARFEQIYLDVAAADS
jgi:colanic acid/amylovoran biosynthesis glycosyltransferase